jgi:hypothetical protein
MGEMSHVEVPTAIHLANPQLERFADSIQAGVSNWLQIAGFPTRRNLISGTALTVKKDSDDNRKAGGKPTEELLSGRHPVASPYWTRVCFTAMDHET